MAKPLSYVVQTDYGFAPNPFWVIYAIRYKRTDARAILQMPINTGVRQQDILINV